MNAKGPFLEGMVADFLRHCRTGDPALEPAAMAVTRMTFTATPEEQWRMVLEAVRQARDDFDLACIAVGPVEGLLGKHGEKVIDRAETVALSDLGFLRMLTGVTKHSMSEEVWERVESLRATVNEPLQVTDVQMGRLQDERIRFEEELLRQVNERLNELEEP